MSLSSPKGGFLHGNDAQGRYPDSWYAATAIEHPELPALEGHESCDVCIIGAGYTGLSSALHLAQMGHRVILLEAHRVGWGASGRNGGQVGTGQRLHQDELERLMGGDDARHLWLVGEAAKGLVKQLVAEHGIDCNLTPGILYADHKRSYTTESRAYVEKLNTDYDYRHIRFVDEEEVREMVGSPAYYGGTLDMDAARIHPLNFALGLSGAVRKAGAKIYENSQVLSVEKGAKVKLTCATGTVTADHVILACNGYIEALMPKVASRVMPLNNYIIATEPLSEDCARALIRDDVAVADSKFVVNYYHLSPDRRMVFGGGESYSFKFPDDIKSFVRRPMLKIYPQLADARIDYGWGGTLGITVNRMPYFAKLESNILNASGFSGHGVAMATLAGQIMAEAINGQASRFDLMAKVPTYLFPGGRHLRFPLLVLAMLYYSVRDRL